MNVNRIAAALRTTIRESPVLKQLAFCRRTISSMRGCCHLPGVETAGEALRPPAPEGEKRPFCGVRAFLTFVAGDCACD